MGSNRVLVQIPMDKELRDKATKAVLDMGFSSLQDGVRLWLNLASKGEFRIGIYPSDPVKLSPQAELRYEQMKEDVEQGKNVSRVYDGLDDYFSDMESAS